jgi:hypothetical protein
MKKISLYIFLLCVIKFNAGFGQVSSSPQSNLSAKANAQSVRSFEDTSSVAADIPTSLSTQAMQPYVYSLPDENNSTDRKAGAKKSVTQTSAAKPKESQVSVNAKESVSTDKKNKPASHK